MEKKASAIGPMIYQAKSNRQIGLVFLGFSILIGGGSLTSNHGPRGSEQFWFGIEIALAVVSMCLAGVSFAASRTILRHRDAEGSYWQSLQDKFRPRILAGLTCISVVGLVLLFIALLHKEYFGVGLACGLGGVCGLIALLSVTGGISPVRFDI
jgi:hypothetical protein